jgi:hypothetical protein
MQVFNQALGFQRRKDPIVCLIFSGRKDFTIRLIFSGRKDFFIRENFRIRHDFQSRHDFTIHNDFWIRTFSMATIFLACAMCLYIFFSASILIIFHILISYVPTFRAM